MPPLLVAEGGRMKRFFLLRHYNGTLRRPFYVMLGSSAGRRHLCINALADASSEPSTNCFWTRTSESSLAALLNPERWMEIDPDKVTEVWHHICSCPRPSIHDAREDPVLFVARVLGPPVSAVPVPRPPIKTSNTKHKIGVPKNKLP